MDILLLFLECVGASSDRPVESGDSSDISRIFGEYLNHTNDENRLRLLAGIHKMQHLGWKKKCEH